MTWLSWKTVGLFFKAYGLQILLLIAVLGGLWYVDHRGYQRADNEHKLKDAQTATLQAQINTAVSDLRGKFQQDLQQIVQRHDAELFRKLNDLDITEKTIVQPTLVKEIASAPHLTDPAYGITDGMLRVLNQARASSWPSGACTSGADGSTTCRLPPARPAEGQDNRNPR